MRTSLLLILFAFVASSFAQTGYYRVKFPDDFTVYGCGAKADTIYPIIDQYPGCPFGVGITVKDMVFNLNKTGGCKKILRTWTLIYWCDYDPNKDPVFIINPTDTDEGPTLFGIPANRGHLQYTQVIKVVDQQAPVFIDCPKDSVVFCDYTDNDPAQYNNGHIDRCEAPVDLRIRVTDACSKGDLIIKYRLFLDLDGNGTQETFISSSAAGAWPIDQTTVGDTVVAHIQFPSGFGFPYGMHKIEWIANDNCGNESICKYTFITKDCKAPSLVCMYGMSVNIMQTGMITVNDQIFITRITDNCTPTGQLKTGIRKAGTGAGFPANQNTVTFDCSELGPQFVEVWGRDASGNADFCLTFIDVQDNMGSCPPSSKFVAKVTTPDGDPIPGVQVALKKDDKVLANYTTDDNGLYEVGNLKAGCKYELLPSLQNNQAKEGINVLDALLLAAHLEDIAPLGSPYYLLAGDVDQSGDLTPADVQQLVKIILGLQQNFPAYAKVWHFAPAHFVFKDPLAPWTAAIPNATSPFCISGAMPAPKADFIGYKIGDLNGTAKAGLTGAAISERGNSKPLAFMTKDQLFGAGEEVRVSIQTPDLAQLVGFQYTLEYDTDVLSLQSILPELIPDECIATPAAGHITTCWHSPILLDPTIIGKNMSLPTFTLVFRSLKSGSLGRSLRMSSAITPAEAYLRDLSPTTIGLFFQPVAVGPKKGLGPTSLELSVRPSVVLDRIQAAYFLPQEGEVALTLTDASGNVLHTRRLYQREGYHQALIELGTNVRPGLLFLRLESSAGVEVQRLTKM
jgi:hypothetical protein